MVDSSSAFDQLNCFKPWSFILSLRPMSIGISTGNKSVWTYKYSIFMESIAKYSSFDRQNCSQYSPSLRNNFDSLARYQPQSGSFYVSEMSLGTRLHFWKSTLIFAWVACGLSIKKYSKKEENVELELIKKSLNKNLNVENIIRPETQKKKRRWWGWWRWSTICFVSSSLFRRLGLMGRMRKVFMKPVFKECNQKFAVIELSLFAFSYNPC